jgi:hypothetical protein
MSALSFLRINRKWSFSEPVSKFCLLLHISNAVRSIVVYIHSELALWPPHCSRAPSSWISQISSHDSSLSKRWAESRC